MAALTDKQREVLARMAAAAKTVEYATELMLEATTEMQLAAAELDSRHAREFELIAFDAIARARS